MVPIFFSVYIFNFMNRYLEIYLQSRRGCNESDLDWFLTLIEIGETYALGQCGS